MNSRNISFKVNKIPFLWGKQGGFSLNTLGSIQDNKATTILHKGSEITFSKIIFYSL